MLNINKCSITQIKSSFPQFKINAYSPKGTHQTSRFIQVMIEGYDDDLHYEYCIDGNWEGYVELHFEGNWDEKYGTLIDSLIENTQNIDEFHWGEWSCGYRCRHSQCIDTVEQLTKTLSYMMDVFNKLLRIKALENKEFETKTIENNKTLPQKERVELYVKRLEYILSLPLSIPNYQRIYCWDENNVKRLLDDVFEHLANTTNTPYRLGTIILHYNDDSKYDVIDGQQRLITLTLLLSEMGVKSCLLEEHLFSKRSVEYVAYNKFLIQKYIQRNKLHVIEKVDKLLEQIEFSVLVLQKTSIDLAYTFFSNQNSRGVVLTDYDLLKAHHLRYISSSYEKQSKHAAEVWNKMIEDGRIHYEENAVPDYVRMLDTYLYRLRKWMRNKECDDSTDKYRIKKEYEAAPVVEEIPPFGEMFFYSDPIQGGTHFFAFVEQHLNKYHRFVETEEYRVLHNSITKDSHLIYRDVIETILFAYFLKFDTLYLADALSVILRIILQHRYTNGVAKKASIVKYAGDTELTMMINQATSPTFFLAEARNLVKDMSYPSRQIMSPIMRTMRMMATNISLSLRHKIVIDSFTNINK